MTKKQRAGKLSKKMYKGLPPKQRLRTMLEVEAEGDFKEGVVIAKAAPLVSYRSTEKEFAELARAADLVVREFRIALRNLKSDLARANHCFALSYLCFRDALGKWLKLHPEAREALPESDSSVLERARDAFHESEVILGPFRVMVDSVLREPALMQAKWHLEAYRQCCREDLGVDPQLLLRAYGDESDEKWVETLEDAIEDSNLDPEDTEDEECIKKVRTRYDQLCQLIPTENENE